MFEKRKGYGRAYKTGFDAVNGEIIVTLDADGTYPVELIPKYIQRLNEKNMDFITVNRVLRNRKRCNESFAQIRK